MSSRIPGTAQKLIRVKFISKVPNIRVFQRQIPGQRCWGDCEFIFDQQNNNYDWLVVYDDLPNSSEGKTSLREESLSCPWQNTLLVTTEPSNIKVYGDAYVEQFGHILTSQEPWALHHADRIYSQPALRWFYGISKNHERSILELQNAPPPIKEQIIATVCSNKQQKHTLHYHRYNFIQDMKILLPELEIYGRGVRDIDDKAESLDSYKYHIAIENHFAPHHWTEKLSDAFLGYTLPFYYGCPNLADYFPEDSFIRIDINDVEGSHRIITEAIANNEYEKRLNAITEARRLVIEKYNLFAVLADNISKLHNDNLAVTPSRVLLSRRAARKRYPVKGLLDLLKKARNLLINRFRH